MAAFDGDGSALPGMVLLAILFVLEMPLGLTLAQAVNMVGLGGFPFEHVAFLMNSVLWGWTGVWLWDRVRERREAARAVETAG
jgi:hypothetical protein